MLRSSFSAFCRTRHNISTGGSREAKPNPSNSTVPRVRGASPMIARRIVVSFRHDKRPRTIFYFRTLALDRQRVWDGALERLHGAV